MSDPIIARDFSFSRDFRHINWGATLKHNLLRAFCAGVVFAIIGMFTGKPHFVDPPIMLPLIFPVAYLLVFLPLGLLCAFLAKLIPFIGLVTLVCSFFVIPGDPIVWFLSLVAPKIVPMYKPAFLIPVMIIWLLKADEVTDIPISDQRAINRR